MAEYTRLWLEAYVAGEIDTRDELYRISKELGDTATLRKLRKPAVVSTAQQNKIAQSARVDADELIAELELKCKRVLTNALDTPEYDSNLIRNQLGQVPRSYLDWNEVGGGLAFAYRARRKVRVRDREKYEKWQRTKMPYLKALRTGRIYQDVLERALVDGENPELTQEERKRSKELAKRMRRALKKGEPPSTKMKQAWARTRLHTGRVLYYNKGRIAKAKEIGAPFMQWTSKRDGRVCARCRALDPPGSAPWIVRIDSAAYQNFTAPIHARCRCIWLPVTDAMAEKFGVKKETALPKIDGKPVQPDIGYGKSEGTYRTA